MEYMPAETPETPSPFNSWETVRCELLHTRVCDLGLKIEGSPMEPFTQRLHREFAAKGLAFRRLVLSDRLLGLPRPRAGDRHPLLPGRQTTGPDRGGADRRDRGRADDDDAVRHEAGHTISYAYRLWKEPAWAEVFGPFSKPYRECSIRSR